MSLKTGFISGVKDISQEALANYHTNFDKYSPNRNIGGLGGDDKAEIGVYGSGASAWVSACVNQWNRDISNMRFFIKDKKGEEIENYTGDLVDPIINGYANMDFSGMAGIAASRIKLAGNDIWLKDRAYNKYNTIFKTVGQFIIVPAGCWKINLDFYHTGIKNYTINFGNGLQRDFLPEEIIHFKDGNIINANIGTGAIAQARMNVESEKVSQEYQNTYFESDGNPNLVYIDKNVSNMEDAKSRGQLIKSNYEDKKYNKSLMYAFGDVDISTLGVSASDLEYIETKKLNREAIISIMGSTPAVLGLEKESGNRAISIVATNNYYKRVNSLASLLVQAFNMQYFNVEMNKDMVSLGVQKYATGDYADAKVGVEAGMLTPNEGRQMIGKERIEDTFMDVVYLSKAYAPIDMVNAGIATNGLLGIAQAEQKKNCQLI